jgi:methionine synthase II (cobalamin-independent)
MKRSEYMKKAFEAFNAGRISEEAYDQMLMNADIFCEDDDDRYGLPRTYAEVEYEDIDSLEAYEGSRFDDRNYLRYRER